MDAKESTLTRPVNMHVAAEDNVVIGVDGIHLAVERVQPR